MRRSIEGPFNLALRELLFRTTCRHRQGETPNILLYCTPRSGSTWILNTVAAHPGLRYVGRPFMTALRSRWRHAIPDPAPTTGTDATPCFGNFIHYEGDTLARFERFARKIVEAESADPPAALPVQIMPHLLLGDKECASKVEALTAKGVTHVLNCAGRDGRDVATYKKYREVGIETESIDEAEDTEGYPLLYAHQLTASKFIEQAKRSGGVCLIHCMAGINRSGALAIAELMTHERISVVDAVREVKLARGVVLQNQSFQCQLVQMARREGLLGDRPEAEPAAEAKKTK